MAEHLIQDTTLTGIADMIRSLLGLTGTMTTDQMQTNLTTEQANITAALAALAEKGVTVPAGATSNELEELIRAISVGGGMRKITATISFPTAVSAAVDLTNTIDGTVVFAVLRNTISFHDYTATETQYATALSVYTKNEDGTEMNNYCIHRTNSTSGTARPLQTNSVTSLYILNNKVRFYAQTSKVLFGDYELTYFVV